jgi:hypothetical protein
MGRQFSPYQNEPSSFKLAIDVMSFNEQLLQFIVGAVLTYPNKFFIPHVVSLRFENFIRLPSHPR